MIEVALLMIAAVLVGLLAFNGLLWMIVAAMFWPLGYFAGVIFRGLSSGFWRGREL